MNIKDIHDLRKDLLELTEMVRSKDTQIKKLRRENYELKRQNKDPHSKIKHTKKEPVCKGILFKGKTISLLNKRKEIVLTEKLVPAMKVSCTGCSKCMPLRKYFEETLSTSGLPAIDIRDEIVNGELYILCKKSEDFDFKPGFGDYDLQIIREDIYKLTK